MDSAGAGSGNQGGGSKRKTSVPIIYFTSPGLTYDKTEKTADAVELDEVNSDGYRNPSNDGDGRLDKSISLRRNLINILADQRMKLSRGGCSSFYYSYSNNNN